MTLPGQTFTPIPCAQCGMVLVERTSATHRYCRACGIERTALLRDVQKVRSKLTHRAKMKADPKYRAHVHQREGLRKHYGLSISEYKRMLKRQNGVCRICRQPCSTGRQLAVDHDAKTGLVRGLLCGKCNRGIGGFDDNPERLERAAAYLRGRL